MKKRRHLHLKQSTFHRTHHRLQRIKRLRLRKRKAEFRHALQFLLHADD